MLTVRDALVTPVGHGGRQSGPAAHGAVYDAEGLVVDAALMRRKSEHWQLPDGAPLPAAAERLEGRTLWGGVLFPHFGHVITETVSRLAAWDGSHDHLLFQSVAPHPTGPEGPPGYLREVFDFIGVPLDRMRLALRTVRVAELAVPPQGYDLARRLAPDHRDFLAGCGARVLGGVQRRWRRLYVSRAGWVRGPVPGEVAFEAAMAEAGFDILRPETLPFADQVRRFAEAEVVVGIAGSQLHHVMYCPDPLPLMIEIERRTKRNVAQVAINRDLGIPTHWLHHVVALDEMNNRAPTWIDLDAAARRIEAILGCRIPYASAGLAQEYADLQAFEAAFVAVTGGGPSPPGEVRAGWAAAVRRLVAVRGPLAPYLEMLAALDPAG
jgi:hypothetical protein